MRTGDASADREVSKEGRLEFVGVRRGGSRGEAIVDISATCRSSETKDEDDRGRKRSELGLKLSWRLTRLT